jgi:pimeloyl-ACP methyl ester carboxylesterase
MTKRPCVLVHGGWCGGWHWDEVRARLRPGQGAVFAPTLTGLAERAHEATPETGLHAHIADVVRVIDDHDLYDVVLVGHSYGGMVITGVAHERADRIAELVYLDAWVPEDGQSMAGILGPDFVAAACAAAEQAGTPTMVPPLFSVEDAVGWTGERAAAFAARRSYQPIQTMYEAVATNGDPRAERSFISCTEQSLGMFDAYAAAARCSSDWRYYALPSPHDAVHAMPAAVAGIIDSIRES